MTFAERLRAARLQRGLTQLQVASVVGVDRSTVADYESGAALPRLSSAPALCNVLRVSADWLLGVTLPAPSAERQSEYRDRVLSAVCFAFDVRREDVLGPRRHAMPTAARHAAMWLMIEHVGMTFESVGRFFGGRDHTTVCHARNNVESWEGYDAPLWSRVQIALSILGASGAPAVPQGRRAPRNPASDTPDGDRASTGRAEASLETFSLFNSMHEAA